MKTIFRELTAPEGLLSLVLARIARIERRAARLRLAAFAIATAVSVILIVPTVEYIMNELYVSGFVEYASLFLDSAARGYWLDVLYSLIYTIPSLAMLAFIAIAVVFVWSLRHIRHDAPIAFARASA